jgi:hypothetical protein
MDDRVKEFFNRYWSQEISFAALALLIKDYYDKLEYAEKFGGKSNNGS